MKHKQVEILAPAGSFESMTAAVAAGADAVYIGGSRFGARAYADNPDEERLLKAIDYAHLHGCKLYMTVNTLVKEEELSGLYSYLKPYYIHGLDAVIVQDLGVFSFIREHFPDLPIHASTQMTITGYHGARTLADMGAARIVTARELSLEEIREIRDKADVEIESFVHGALCYCYSGQCLFSSLIGGRSGNRGRCAQPCRLPYDVKRGGQALNRRDEKYVLSLKDLCTLDIIPDMIEAGVYSMKIEGRMKSPRYTAGVVSIYRKYVDLYLEKGRIGYQVDEKDKQMLLELFDRGGFTEGYYTRHNGADMVARREKPAFRQGDENLFQYLDETFVNSKKQLEISGEVVLREGEPARFQLVCGEALAKVMGEIPQKAQNQPLTEERVMKQMLKTGNTPFHFGKLEARVYGDLFLPLQSLNELRRAGLEALEEAALEPYRRLQPSSAACIEKADMRQDPEETPLELHVLLGQVSGLEEVLSVNETAEIMIESDGFEPDKWKSTAAQCHKRDKRCVLAMPPVFRREARSYFDSHFKQMTEAGFDAILIRSLEEVDYLKERQVEIPLIFDHNLYIFNHLAARMMQARGAARLTMPVELNSRELEKTGCRGRELIVYGYLPMMISAQCIKKTVETCTKKPEFLYLKDRMGKELRVRNHCRFCYNTIYNISPLSLLGQEPLIERLAPAAVRLQFTIENPEQIRMITKGFAASLFHGGAVDFTLPEFTRGHFKRGVE